MVGAATLLEEDPGADTVPLIFVTVLLVDILLNLQVLKNTTS